MNDFEKAQKNKQRFIGKVVDSKELSIKVSSTMRDAVLLTIAQLESRGLWDRLFGKKVTGEMIRNTIMDWRAWEWEAWETYPQEPEKAPYSEDFLLDALTNKTYKSEAQKSFYEAMLRKWYGHTTNVDDDARGEGMIAREEERAARNENV